MGTDQEWALAALTRLRGEPRVRTHLTPREYTVMELLANGATRASAAQDMHISEQTLKNHVSSVLRVVGASSLIEAYFKMGWLRVPGHASPPVQQLMADVLRELQTTRAALVQIERDLLMHAMAELDEEEATGA